MSKKNNVTNFEFRIKAIELLNSTLILPPIPNNSTINYNFNLNIESHIDNIQKVIFVITNVEIKNNYNSESLGSIKLSCIFEISNFDEIIKFEHEGVTSIPEDLVNILNQISISTTRGVMFSTYKGTYLHDAILPIIMPSQIKLASKKTKKYL